MGTAIKRRLDRVESAVAPQAYDGAFAKILKHMDIKEVPTSEQHAFVLVWHALSDSADQELKKRADAAGGKDEHEANKEAP
jgi:hypothetical protein